ncbi:MAG: response receiver [Alphaproteobacteria bacterium]|nr:response receiver [Alphaproteobacteria bacterium]
MPNSEAVMIVMIEDDPGHAALIQKNLRRAGISNEIKHIENGREAADYLLGTGEFAGNRPQAPMLILLDLNLPEMDGFEILQKIKGDEITKLIPVIILTTTDNPREVERCYALGCNVYVTKPVEYDAFAESIRKLGLLLAVVKVPGEIR